MGRWRQVLGGWSGQGASSMTYQLHVRTDRLSPFVSPRLQFDRATETTRPNQPKQSRCTFGHCYLVCILVLRFLNHQRLSSRSASLTSLLSSRRGTLRRAVQVRTHSRRTTWKTTPMISSTSRCSSTSSRCEPCCRGVSERGGYLPLFFFFFFER